MRLAVVAAVLASVASAGHTARAPIVIVPASHAAATRATITGASSRERVAGRAALALVGAEAGRLRLRFATEHGNRVLTVGSSSRAGTRASRVISAFLAGLVATDAADRLATAGERIAWRVGRGGASGVGRRRVGLPRRALVGAAQTIEARAEGSGWKLAPLRAYTTAGGGLVVIVRLDDRALLGSQRNAFRSTLLGPPSLPVRHVLLLIEGPDGVVVGGGSDDGGWIYGGMLEPASAHTRTTLPGWLSLGRTDLKVTIYHPPGVGPPQGFTVSCGIASSATPRATCTRLLRERSVLFSPIQNDAACTGVPADGSSVEGVVGGVPVERLFGDCYIGATRAWEELLQS